MKIKEIIVETKQRLDAKCWKGKHKEGTKIKGGIRVNNCVPNESVEEGYGRYWCSTDKKWKERKGPKQNRKTSEAANPAQQAAIAIAKKKKKQMSEELSQEFDIIERMVEHLADQHAVDPELVWEDLESLSDDELYVFAVTQEPVNEDWQKVNKKDKTDGMSRKAVNAYRREHPGSKLKTAVTTKPSKLKRGSKASKRRKSYCSRSAGQKRMHHIDCSKTPDKAICKARRRWNC
jgi:protein-tyrosine-phosphatase